MARNGIKTGGRNFLPGNCANPNGPPEIPPDLKHLRTLNYKAIEEVCKFVMAKDMVSLEVAAKSTTLPALVAGFANMALKGFRGDKGAMQLVMAYAVGLPKAKLEVVDSRTTDRFSHLSDEEIDAKLKQEQQRLMEYGQ